MNMLDVVKAAIVGHAIGDALGVPVEFATREKLTAHPVTDMIGYGAHNVPKGCWSDDTSMTLCTLGSIISKGKIDLDDIMQNFEKWLQEGYMTPCGKAFGIGRTCLHAVMNYHRGSDALHCGCSSEKENGNGSLMRIIPVSLYNNVIKASRDEAIKNIHRVSALTHAHERSLIACGIYDFIIAELILNPTRASVYAALGNAENYYSSYTENDAFKRLYKDRFCEMPGNGIKSSGYVVDTLEAAVWCLVNTASYKECVLKAVNLGQDTDTVAAVAGGLAGILYGFQSIPTEWIDSLLDKDKIFNMCTDFCRKFEVA